MDMVAYTQHDGESVAPLADEVVALYATVYSEPPYEEGFEQVERFRAGLPEEMSRPGFSLVAALEDDGRLVGIAYGWTMAAGNWWSQAEPPPNEVRDSAKLAVMEWIVEPGRRGRGVGAELIRRLLADRTERYATLASDPRSTARAMYDRAGWQQVSRTTLAWGPVMDLLILDLRGARSAPASASHR